MKAYKLVSLMHMFNQSELFGLEPNDIIDDEKVKEWEEFMDWSCYQQDETHNHHNGVLQDTDYPIGEFIVTFAKIILGRLQETENTMKPGVYFAFPNPIKDIIPPYPCPKCGTWMHLHEKSKDLRWAGYYMRQCAGCDYACKVGEEESYKEVKGTNESASQQILDELYD